MANPSDTITITFPIDEVVAELERFNLTESELDRALSAASRRALAAGRDRALREIGALTGIKDRKYWNPLNSPSGGKPNRVRWRVGATTGDAKLWVGLNEVRVKRYRFSGEDRNRRFRAFDELAGFTGQTAQDAMVQVYRDAAVRVAEQIVRGV